MMSSSAQPRNATKIPVRNYGIYCLKKGIYTLANMLDGIRLEMKPIIQNPKSWMAKPQLARLLNGLKNHPISLIYRNGKISCLPFMKPIQILLRQLAVLMKLNHLYLVV